MKPRPHVLSALVLVVLALSTGCNLAGPSALTSGRLAYNEVIRQTEMEQLLLNIVRMRFVEPPFFIQVGSVTAQYSLEGEFGLNATVPNQNTSASSFGPNFKTKYTEKPTVSLSPLSGDRFSAALFEPINPETLLLLSYSGWGLERLLLVCVNHLNRLPNSPYTLPGGQAYGLRDFRRAAKLLGELQLEGRASLLLEQKVPQKAGRRHLVLSLADDGDPRLAEVRKLLELDPDQTRVLLRFGFVPAETRDEISFGTRSFMRTLSILCRGVEVPPEQRNQTFSDGPETDWQAVFANNWRVGSGDLDAPPLVEVEFRGATYWISSTDLETKATFQLLNQLYAIQTGNLAARVPLITLSAGD